MKRLVFLLLGAVWTVTAFAAGPDPSSAFAIETIAQDLNTPHAIAFLPNGDALIAEKAGRILMLRDRRVLDHPVATIPGVLVSQLSGLVDIAIDPSFAENGQVYVSYAEGPKDPWNLVVAVAKLESDKLVDLRKILTLAPSQPNEHQWGGYLAFWRDGTLLMTVADGGDLRAHAQRRESLLGKVIRITREGSAAADNPFVATPGARPEIFTMGHRHAIGLLYDSVQDIIYENENGPWGGDEINVLEPGKNYGWPLATYGMDYSGAFVTPFRTYPGTEPPILYWDPSIAPSGMAQCRKCLWPGWEGNLLVGALAGKKVVRVDVAGKKVLNQESLFRELGYRIRDVAFGPDGALYLLTDESKGRLLRVTPKAGP